VLSFCFTKRHSSPPTLPHGWDEFQECKLGNQQGHHREFCSFHPHTHRKASPWMISFVPSGSTPLTFIVWCKSLWNENIKEPFIKILSVVKSVNCALAHLFLLSIKMVGTCDCHCISPGDLAPVWEKYSWLSLKKDSAFLGGRVCKTPGCYLGWDTGQHTDPSPFSGRKVAMQTGTSVPISLFSVLCLH
jgi:hypothetical protein